MKNRRTSVWEENAVDPTYEEDNVPLKWIMRQL